MARKKGSGGKLNRSEILQARINPKLRFALELMARMERRTVSSFIEGLIERAAKETEIDMRLPEHASLGIGLPAHEQQPPQRITVEKAVRHIWTPEEPERFVAMALSFPDLLNEYEESLWALIQVTPCFWEHFQFDVKNPQGNVVGKEWWPLIEYQRLVRDNLRQYWPLLNDVINGRVPLNEFQEATNTIGKETTKPEHYPEVTKIKETAWASDTKK